MPVASWRQSNGADQAVSAQREIIAEFLARGIDRAQKDGKGKTVLECARAEWILQMLS
jgi:hypothetical protein